MASVPASSKSSTLGIPFSLAIRKALEVQLGALDQPVPRRLDQGMAIARSQRLHPGCSPGNTQASDALPRPRGRTRPMSTLHLAPVPRQPLRRSPGASPGRSCPPGHHPQDLSKQPGRQLCDRDCGSGSIPATTPPRAPSNVLAFSRRQCGYFHHMVQHDRTHAEHTSLTTSLAHRSTGPLALPEQCRLALILREALPKVFATVATTLQYMK